MITGRPWGWRFVTLAVVFSFSFEALACLTLIWFFVEGTMTTENYVEAAALFASLQVLKLFLGLVSLGRAALFYFVFGREEASNRFQRLLSAAEADHGPLSLDTQDYAEQTLAAMLDSAEDGVIVTVTENVERLAFTQQLAGFSSGVKTMKPIMGQFVAAALDDAVRRWTQYAR